MDLSLDLASSSSEPSDSVDDILIVVSRDLTDGGFAFVVAVFFF